MNFHNKILSILDVINGTSIAHYNKILHNSENWNREEIQHYQNKKLKEIVNHAYNNTIYYKNIFDKLKIKPNDINTVKDLQILPIINKEIIQKNYSDFLAKNIKKASIQKRSTGGTTGAPLNYLSDLNSWSLHWALKYRAWRWANYYPGTPIGIIAGASIIPDKKVGLKRKIWNKLNSFYPLSASHLNPELMLEYSGTIKKSNIKFLRGYPSSIAHFAKFCLQQKISLGIKSVITTAEVLRPEYKEAIKKAFECDIYDTYGCADGGGNANTCKFDNGFHISIEASIWEICNNKGESIDENQLGEITLTSLANYAMPMIRYQPGDLAENAIDWDVCKCGCRLPRIKRIYGRSTDILTFRNNNTLGGPALTLLFREFAIKNYQVIQKKSDLIIVKIVPMINFDDSQKIRIKKILSYHCGQEITVEIVVVDKIPLPKSGKHRFIINETL